MRTTAKQRAELRKSLDDERLPGRQQFLDVIDDCDDLARAGLGLNQHDAKAVGLFSSYLVMHGAAVFLANALREIAEEPPPTTGPVAQAAEALSNVRLKAKAVVAQANEKIAAGLHEDDVAAMVAGATEGKMDLGSAFAAYHTELRRAWGALHGKDEFDPPLVRTAIEYLLDLNPGHDVEGELARALEALRDCLGVG